jgi:hypothetical protein
MNIPIEKRVQQALMEFPEVEMVVSKIGRTELGNDPQEPNESDPVVRLQPLEQWKRRIHEELAIEVGVYGGGENAISAVTVCTYDSAFLRAGELGNRFSLVIFDEVHHLPAESFRQIAEMFTATYRLGLTATYEREDMLHLLFWV